MSRSGRYTWTCPERSIRFVGEFIEGVAKPVGGDDDAVFDLDDEAKLREEAAALAQLAECGNQVRVARTGD
jgi:hypothetical protein